MRRSRGEKIFGVFNILLMCLLIFIMLYPFWYVIIASFSNPVDVARGLVVFTPSGFNLTSIRHVLGMEEVWRGYLNTIFYAVAGTAITMTLTVMGAYPLSRRRLRGRKLFMIFILITMWFSAGMVPHFLNFQSIPGMMNGRFTMLFVFAISTFHVILLRTFFENVPDSMEESAKMDGANDITVLTRIFMPLSVPALAAITLFSFVGRWNAWFWAQLLLRNPNYIPLQVVLRRMIVEASFTANETADFSMFELTEQTVIYATIVVAVIPMLVVYPFVQKFFVRGIMVGAIKG